LLVTERFQFPAEICLLAANDCKHSPADRKEAVICDSGSRDLAGVTLNSSKMVFYEFCFPSCSSVFQNKNYFENDYIVCEADWKNDTCIDQGRMQIK
jgi:hypothetical protein